MKKSDYERVIGFLKQHKYLGRLAAFGSRQLPILIAMFYVLLLVAVGIRHIAMLPRIIIVPAATFVVVSVFRNLLNRPRPYTTLGFEPLIPYKKDKGKSFPSRHTVCAIIIGCTFCYVYMPVGVIVMCLAFGVAVSRVATGMHYISDVVAGIGSGLLFALVGYVLI